MVHMTADTAGYRDSGMAESTARPRPGRSDDTRAALLAAAHDLLASEGPGALTVRRIAAAAGMSTMNVYSRFGGKDGVLDELFIDGFRRMTEEMSAAPLTDDPLEDLRRCGIAYRDFARRNPTYYSLMFDRPVPEFRPSDQAMETALGALGRVVSRVERAMDAGLIPRDDPFVIASALWACDHGLASLEAKTGIADEPLFDWQRIGDTAIDALVRGLATAR